MTERNSYYYECHVTLDPIDEELRYSRLKELCSQYGFWTSAWSLNIRETHKFFATSRSKDFDTLNNAMRRLIFALKRDGFKIWRYKIEDTILDSKVMDEYKLVDAIESPVLESFDKIGV